MTNWNLLFPVFGSSLQCAPLFYSFCTWENQCQQDGEQTQFFRCKSAETTSSHVTFTLNTQNVKSNKAEEQTFCIKEPKIQRFSERRRVGGTCLLMLTSESLLTQPSEGEYRILSPQAKLFKVCIPSLPQLQLPSLPGLFIARRTQRGFSPEDTTQLSHTVQARWPLCCLS